ncbi:MAG TPA: low-specificity L-threonine aldolase [Phycisphaerae bacterium]|nr:low-specificity L-threonine aldolase [Phycisphaerae bacterium]
MIAFTTGESCIVIDLRSDTVTRPTPAMRRSMANAEVADDVYGEDPTVNALEERVAGVLGKETAVFMPTGTQANQTAIRTHTEPGDEIILDANTHSYFFESGGPAALSGVMCRLIPTERGIFSAADVLGLLRPRNEHYPHTKLVCVENTHNLGGGSVWPIETIREVTTAAREAGLRTHLDGARLWNASAATGVSERDYASHFDSVSVCFSKGLGAPVGSALAGSAEFIVRARRFRKMFGGGMRQAGIIAAGALYALEHHRDRLKDDHANARLLAEALADLPGIEVDLPRVETNIVNFRVTAMPARQLCDKARECGVLMLDRKDTLRAVTHLNVGRPDILSAVDAIRTILTRLT